jgi:putative membrane protein insertion efficiency factor
MRLIFLFAIFATVFSSNAAADEDCPAHCGDQVIVDRSTSDQGSADTESFPVRSVRFYQRYLSGVIGDRCQMYPSCSEYSIAAIKKHGPLIGIVMTVDRFFRELDETSLAPIVTRNDEPRFYDPVEENDFWWANNKK